MTLVDYTLEDVPEWALSYLVNSDASGLEDEEIAEVDAWYAERRAYLDSKYPDAHVVFDIKDDDEPSFNNSPAIGLPCNTVRCAFVVLLPDELATNYHPIEFDWED